MRKIFCLVLVFVLSGCAGFASKDTQNVDGFSNVSSNKKNIEYQVTSIYNDNLLNFTLAQSDMFNKIGNSIDNADYSLYVSRYETLTTDTVTLYGTAFITGFSFYLIPSWYNIDVVYNARLVDNKSKIQKQFVYKENYKNVMHISMLLVAPFVEKQPNDIDERITRKMVYDIGQYIYGSY